MGEHEVNNQHTVRLLAHGIVYSPTIRHAIAGIIWQPTVQLVRMSDLMQPGFLPGQQPALSTRCHHLHRLKIALGELGHFLCRTRWNTTVSHYTQPLPRYSRHWQMQTQKSADPAVHYISISPTGCPPVQVQELEHTRKWSELHHSPWPSPHLVPAHHTPHRANN